MGSDGGTHAPALEHKFDELGAMLALGVVGEPVVEMFGAGSPCVGEVSGVLHGDVGEVLVEYGPGGGEGEVVLLDEDIAASDYHSPVLVQRQHIFPNELIITPNIQKSIPYTHHPHRKAKGLDFVGYLPIKIIEA